MPLLASTARRTIELVVTTLEGATQSSIYRAQRSRHRRGAAPLRVRWRWRDTTPLAHQKALAELVPGRGVPGWIAETLVLGQRTHAIGRIAGSSHKRYRRQCCQPSVASVTNSCRWSGDIMRAGPVEPGRAKRARTETAGHAPEPGSQHRSAWTWPPAATRACRWVSPTSAAFPAGAACSVRTDVGRYCVSWGESAFSARSAAGSRCRPAARE